MSDKVLNVGVLVSGRGTNLQAIIEACAKKEINARIAAVISNKPQAMALERASKAGIPTAVLTSQKGESRESYEKKVEASLKEYGVELIVLAGFMRLVSPYLISKYPQRIINIHPALLPAFPGLDAQKQALDYGARYSGCTVHIVDEGCDTGPIILQSVVPILAGDTVESLSARILKEEHKLFPKAIDLISRNKVKVSGRHVEIAD